MFKKASKKLFIIFLFLVLAIFMVSPQIYRRSLIIGIDSIFHYNRIFEIYSQFTHHQFNYFMSIYSFNASGRIINSIYGYDFSFFLGALLLLSKTWLKFQVLSGILCFFFAGINMYALARYLNVRRIISIIIATLYMSSPLISEYVLSQSFTSWGAAFLPLLFIPALKSILDKNNPINPIWLSLPIYILFSTHLISLLIGVIAITPIYIYSFINSKKKKSWILNIFLSIGLSLLLCSNLLWGFLDVYLSNNILKPITHDFMYDSASVFSQNNADLRNFGLIFTLIFIFQIFYILLSWKETKIYERIITITGGVFLLLSSNLLPWNDLAMHFPLIRFIQFPSRFDVIAYILLLIGFGITIQNIITLKNYETKKITLTMLAVISMLPVISVNNAVSFRSSYWQNNQPLLIGNNKAFAVVKDPLKFKAKFASKNLKDGLDTIIKGTPDYLPLKNKSNSEDIYNRWPKYVHPSYPYQLYKKEILTNNQGFVKTITADSNLKINWYNNTSTKKDIQLPITIYNHSNVIFNNHLLSNKKIQTSELGSLIVPSKPGKNTLIVSYKPTISSFIIYLLKILGYLIILVYLLKNLKIKKHSRT